jgi:hypothetical protein
MQFSPVSYYFILFGPDIPLNILFSNTFSLSSSLILTVQILHPYKTKSEIVILYNLIFIFLGSRPEDERSWTECYQALT